MTNLPGQSPGLCRNRRYVEQLLPSYASIDERMLNDLLEHAERLSEHISFFDSDGNDSASDADWKDLFENVSTLVIEDDDSSEQKPHLALYQVFVQLFQHAQRQLNDIGRRHLDFHFEKILGINKLDAVPDQSHVLFELKKGVRPVLIKAGTRLLAGKDQDGYVREYDVIDDSALSHATIGNIQSVFVDSESDKVLKAPIANSSNGVGGELAENAAWPAFGNPDLPEAEIGFAVASEILHMKEGSRTITLTLELSGVIESNEINENMVNVYFTGEKGWIGPKVAEELSYADKTSELTVKVTLEPDDEAIVGYNFDLHGGAFDTKDPIMQVLLKNDADQHARKYLKTASVLSAEIEVEADKVTGLEIETDFGRVDPSKMFQPFGPEAKSGARMRIKYPEALAKQLTYMELQIQWAIPASVYDSGNDWKDYYSDYDQSDFTWRVDTSVKESQRPGVEILTRTTEGSIKEGSIINESELPETLVLISAESVTSPVVQKSSGNTQSIVMQLSGYYAQLWQKEVKLTNFHVITEFSSPLETIPANESIIIELKTDALTSKYREIFTKWVIIEAKNNNPSPPEPYIPTIRSLKLHYKASTSSAELRSTEESQFLESPISFYHIGAFGQARRHAYLYQRLPFSNESSVSLLPRYEEGGALYIGLADANPGEAVSILIQVDEGSSDPRLEESDLEWSILCDNVWRRLENSEILLDTTNNLLSSGIIQIDIPTAATTLNTLLPSERIWLRARVAGDVNAVCEFININVNAALVQRDLAEPGAVFTGTSLPAGTISQLAESVKGVKGVSQPYASFGGKMHEEYTDFYHRVAERCQHKQRVWTTRDVEKIVLESFEPVFKVKCVRHTSAESLLAPGHSAVVVLPDPSKRYMREPFKPRFPKSQLVDIERRLGRLCTPFAQFHVMNPTYLAVSIKLQVAFREGLSFELYRERLEGDIKKFLAPWAFSTGVEIGFGGRIHKSEVTSRVELFDYVDYVKDVKLYEIDEEDNWSSDVSIVSIGDPRFILTSYTKHEITRTE